MDGAHRHLRTDVTEAGVEFADVSYAFGASDEQHLLRGISLKLEPGTTTALLGRSGSGKTTLMRMVNGLVMPTSGRVSVGGRSTTEWNLQELRRGIGYVIQESGLFPHWTVERNVGLSLELAGKDKDNSRSLRDDKQKDKQKEQRVGEALALTGLDPALASRYPWQLSGGQRQRVGLARALAGDPAVLLMDEPFGALDPMTRAEMQTMLKELLGRVRKTVLLVTHDLDEAIFLAERVVFLDRGEVAADLACDEVLTSDQEYVKRYVAAVHPHLRSEMWGTHGGTHGGGAA
jgi:osmoprotectant transport system ATP-binding protein